MLVEVETHRENAALRAQLANALSTIQSLTEQIAKLNDRVAELVAVAQRKQRKTSSATGDKKPEPPPVLDANARAAFDARPMPPALPDKSKTPKREPQRTGRNALPAHLEVEEHALRPSTCEHCGGSALDVVDEVVEEKLHVVKEHQRRRVVRRTTCRCRACLNERSHRNRWGSDHDGRWALGTESGCPREVVLARATRARDDGRQNISSWASSAGGGCAAAASSTTGSA